MRRRPHRGRPGGSQRLGSPSRIVSAFPPDSFEKGRNELMQDPPIPRMGTALTAVSLFFFFILPAGAQQLLQNGNLKKAQVWPWNHPLYGKSVVKMGIDPKGGVGGTPCLTIEGLVPRGMREWHQNVREGFPKGSAVTLSVMVRTEKSAGNVWIEIRALKGIRFLAGATTRYQEPISGDTPWKRMVLTLTVPKEADILQVAAVLEGKGKAFFDDFLLVPGEAPGAPGKHGGGGAKAPSPSVHEARTGGKEKNGIFLVRYSLELRALHEEKQGRLYVALPALREGQFPFYFKAEALPADGIQSIKAVRKGGRKTPPLLELKILHLKPGEKVKIDMETKVLVLAAGKSLPLPKDLPEKPKYPGKVKPFLTLSRLLRSLGDSPEGVKKAVPPGKDLPSLLASFTGAAGKVREPSLTLAAVLRDWGVPARLVSGVSPSAGPTQPALAVEAWIPGAGWVLLLPSLGLVRPAGWQFILFREIPREGEIKRSRLFPFMPHMGFLEAKGSFRVRGLKDPRKGAYLECLESLPLPKVPPELLGVLVKDLKKNWARWLKAREKGREDADAEFAGEAASQTKDYKEMIRILEGK